MKRGGFSIISLADNVRTIKVGSINLKTRTLKVKNGNWNLEQKLEEDVRGTPFFLCDVHSSVPGINRT